MNPLKRSTGFFSARLEHEMRSRQMSILGLSDTAGCTYEQVRLLTKGWALPSSNLLRSLCRALSLKKKEMEKLVVADRIRHRYGPVVWELAGKNPVLDEFYVLWPYVPEDERAPLLAYASAMARSNRKRGKA